MFVTHTNTHTHTHTNMHAHLHTCKEAKTQQTPRRTVWAAAMVTNLNGLHVHVVQCVPLNHILQFKCFNGSLHRVQGGREGRSGQLQGVEARWGTHLQLCIGLGSSNKAGLHLKGLFLSRFLLSRQSMMHLCEGRVDEGEGRRE